MTTEAVWTSARVEDAPEEAPWSPVLEWAGSSLPLPVWFATEQQADEFIRDEILGATADLWDWTPPPGEMPR